MKNFKLSSLLQNLNSGLGSNIKLDHIKSIHIQLGQDTFAKTLRLLLVNELARLYHSNPNLVFKITESSESFLKIQGDSQPISIELSDQTRPVFNSLIKSLMT